MQQPGPSPRRDWLIIGGLITVVAVSWIGFFLFWVFRRPAAPQPVAPQAAVAPATQATRPAVFIQPRPVLLQPTAPAAPQTQPAPQVNPRDAALLEALQRSEELKKQGKQREALAELQRALQPEASASQPGDQDPQAQLRDLLGKASNGNQSSDSDALLNAAVQILGASVGDTVDFVDDLDAEMSGRRKAPKPQDKPQAAPPAEADIVAYVYGEPVTRSEIGGGSSPTDAAIRKLNQRILEPLLETYGKTQGIKALPGEVAVYQQKVNRIRPTPPATPAAPRRQQGRPALPPMDPVAEAAVIRWKVTRSLYEQYHGTVILNNDRLEPVGAYREFLKEQEAKSDFRIEDPKYRDRFWAYYDRDFGDRVVPAEKVNFGSPWWMKSAGAGGQ